MNVTEKIARGLIESSAEKKSQAMAVANFVKSGKLKKYLETLVAMSKGEGIHEPWAFTVGPTIYLRMRVAGLDSFKGERLQGILMAIEFLNPTKQSVSDFAAELNREFHYSFIQAAPNGGVPLCVHVIIDAFVKSDSPTCRKVIKGYSEVQAPTPIYEIVCDDGDTPPVAADQAQES